MARAALDVSRAQLRSSQATLSQRQASLQSAQLDLDRTIIRSPIDGVVIERSVDVGQTVAASFSAPILFQIAQNLEDIRIDAAVVESDIGGIDAGDPGMTANVEITAEKREGVLRLAESAIRFRPPSEGVNVIASNTESDGQPRRGGPSGGARGNPAEAMLVGLELEPERRTRIETAMRAEMEKVRASMGEAGATFDRNGMRARIQSRMDKVLRDNLSRDELAVVQKTVNDRASRRRVDLYQPAGDGALKTLSVSVGLSDGQNVEILRGAKEGDTFVTRLALAATDK